MPGAVLFDDIFNVVRLESLLELSPGYKVFDLYRKRKTEVGECIWVRRLTAIVEQLEWDDNWMISGSRQKKSCIRGEESSTKPT